MNRSFDAVIFDMDGLMLDTERLSAISWRKAGETTGIAVGEELISGMSGMAMKRCQAFLTQKLGDAAQARALHEESRRQYHHLIGLGGIPLKMGILNTLDWLEAQGIPRAVATSTQKQLAGKKLGHTGLERYFDIVITVDDVPHPKPAPDVYLAAAAALGMAPGRCIALEDSPFGMQAAIAAGMRVIQVPDAVHAHDELQAQALAICADLDQALALLKTL